MRALFVRVTAQMEDAANAASKHQLSCPPCQFALDQYRQGTEAAAMKGLMCAEGQALMEAIGAAALETRAISEVEVRLEQMP